jgi:hypothetical protein
MMRNFAMGCRRRMNEVDSRKNDLDGKAAKPSVVAGAANAEAELGAAARIESVGPLAAPISAVPADPNLTEAIS